MKLTMLGLVFAASSSVGSAFAPQAMIRSAKVGVATTTRSFSRTSQLFANPTGTYTTHKPGDACAVSSATHEGLVVFLFYGTNENSHCGALFFLLVQCILIWKSAEKMLAVSSLSFEPMLLPRYACIPMNDDYVRL
jgi:hypothetical protein